MRPLKKTGQQIIQAIIDVSDEITTDFIIGIDKNFDFALLEQFTQLSPDQVELLGNQEIFCYHASKVKFLKQQLNYLKFSRGFKEESDELSPQVLAVSGACKFFMKSEDFKNFLALVLFCGNYMNSGSNKAQTYGFDITFLRRLKDTKTSDGEMTFLHYLAKLLHNSGTLQQTLTTLAEAETASKVSLSDTTARTGKLSKEVDALTKFVANPSVADTKFGLKMTKEFIGPATDKCDKLTSAATQAEKSFKQISDWLVFDPKKMPADEFFGLLATVKDELKGAHKMNAQREEEKAKKAQQQKIQDTKKQQQGIAAAAAAKRRQQQASAGEQTSEDENEDDYAANLMAALNTDNKARRKRGGGRKRMEMRKSGLNDTLRQDDLTSMLMNGRM
jgi:hypothetical protein